VRRPKSTIEKHPVGVAGIVNVRDKLDNKRQATLIWICALYYVIIRHEALHVRCFLSIFFIYIGVVPSLLVGLFLDSGFSV
jgi:hypothetical protein